MVGSPLAGAYEAPGHGTTGGWRRSIRRYRGARVYVDRHASLKEILVDPARENVGTTYLVGTPRASMATNGHQMITEFQRAELMIARHCRPEASSQRAQRARMGV
jgi:hypothetical protein